MSVIVALSSELFLKVLSVEEAGVKATKHSAAMRPARKATSMEFLPDPALGIGGPSQI
jgi:hypothetical protein